MNSELALRVRCMEMAIDRLRSATALDPMYRKDAIEVAQAFYDWIKDDNPKIARAA